MCTEPARTCVWFFRALFAAAVTSCAGSIPTEATSPPTTPSTTVHAIGNLSFDSYAAGSDCKFQGLVINDGPECASNVRGVTHLFDASRKEIESRQWELAGRIRPAEQRPFSGCCFSTRAVNAQVTSRTDVSFEVLPCI